MKNDTPGQSAGQTVEWFGSVTAGYSDSEDRMWLKLVNQEREVVIWVTRRLIAALIAQGFSFLKGNREPAEWALEHTKAIEPFVARGGDQPPTRSQSLKEHAQSVGLAYEIQLTRRDDKNLFIFKAAQGQFGVPCSDQETHCLVELFFQRAKGAGWGLEAPWLFDQAAMP